MDAVDSVKWPVAVVEFFQSSFGRPVGRERLDGVRVDRGCERVYFSDHSVIVKRMREPNEWNFYRHDVDVVKSLGVGLPQVYLTHQEAESYWVVLEDVPAMLPREAWLDYPDRLQVLVQLHRGTWGDKRVFIEQPYRPAWEDELTRRALAFFPAAIANTIKPWLLQIQEQAQPLFESLCCISGDPNPTNWGLRADRSLVLFDWERWGYGTPAIDLAITIPGFGSRDGALESDVARNYLTRWNDVEAVWPITQETLSRQIQIAKIWSIVEYLATSDATDLANGLTPTIQALVEHLPDLLKQRSLGMID